MGKVIRSVCANDAENFLKMSISVFTDPSAINSLHPTGVSKLSSRAYISLMPWPLCASIFRSLLVRTEPLSSAHAQNTAGAYIHWKLGRVHCVKLRNILSPLLFFSPLFLAPGRLQRALTVQWQTTKLPRVRSATCTVAALWQMAFRLFPVPVSTPHSPCLLACVSLPLPPFAWFCARMSLHTFWRKLSFSFFL